MFFFLYSSGFFLRRLVILFPPIASVFWQRAGFKKIKVKLEARAQKYVWPSINYFQWVQKIPAACAGLGGFCYKKDNE